jgi:MFS family permease
MAAVTAPPRTRLGPGFRFFQAAVLGSDLADGIYRISIPLLALSISHSALAVSAAGVAVRAPWVLATLPAGVAIDRYPPLRVMRLASWARIPIVIALGVLAWRHLLPIWGLVTGAFAVGAGGTFIDVAAQSTVPELAGSQVARANANLQSGQMVMGQFAGPALGGALAASVGAGIGLSAALYAGTVLGLGLLQRKLGAGSAPADRARESGLSLRSAVADLRQGAGYFRRRADLIGLATIAGCGNLAFAAVTTILPLWVVAPGRLGLSGEALGLVLGAPAVGGIAAGVVAARTMRRLGGIGVLRICAPLVGLCYLVMAVPSVAAAGLGMACYGALCLHLNVMSVTYRQSTIPAGLFGRVNSVYRWIILGVSPLGALLGGVIAQTLGVAAVFLGAGAVALAAGAIVPFFAPRRDQHPDAHPPPPAPSAATSEPALKELH